MATWMYGELVPQGGGDPIPLRKKKLLLGRRRDSCDIALPFPNVSSRHCELELVDAYWLVRDLGSSNGTKVNGVRVRCKWVLPGDELAVAKHRYKVDYNVASDAAPPPPLAEDEEEDLNMSLLEKAGLARRRPVAPPRSPSGRKLPEAPPPADQPASRDDEILDWLADDDQ
ncbi:MAG: FHA domain-containing protein [Planctomycetaceae bacterium]